MANSTFSSERYISENVKSHALVKAHCLSVVSANVQGERLRIPKEKVFHELSSDALALAPASDPDAHKVATAVHFKETCIADNALGVALPCNHNLVGR